MFALTADRRGSRSRRVEPVAPLRDRLRAELAPPVLDWQVSAGDEVQAVYADPADVVAAVLALSETDEWHVGLGIGTVDTPYPRTVHEATGPALVAAREAVEASKDTGYPAVRGSGWAADLEAVFTVCCAIRRRRTGPGREAARLADLGRTQQHIARTLHIAQSSVSRRLAAALWSEERAVHPTLTTLLMLAERDADAGRPDQQEPGARARAGGGSGPAGQP